MKRMRHILLCALLATSLFGCMANAQDGGSSQPHVKTEITLMEVHVQSVRIVHADGTTESVDLRNNAKGVEGEFVRMKTLQTVFQRLYADGWEIESEVFFQAGFHVSYVLTRTQH